MDTAFYLAEFKQAAATLETGLPADSQLDIEAGTWLNSVVLRLQKPGWANDPRAKPQTGAAIFFSIWVSKESYHQNRVYYNIHALKLRQLKGHKITARDFAAAFRARFKPLQSQWPNVSVDFGPLTLMEGWTAMDSDPANLQGIVQQLAVSFLSIAPIIEDLLAARKPGVA